MLSIQGIGLSDPIWVVACSFRKLFSNPSMHTLLFIAKGICKCITNHSANDRTCIENTHVLYYLHISV